MYIPSYDDLTPSIPDISMRETLGQVERLLPAARAAAAGVQPRGSASEPGVSAGTGQPLFACLRSPRTPETAMAVARDFSPRIERHGAAAVVLDVSGLGRLLGDAHAIGGELERAAAERATGIRVAVASTQTAARLLAIGHPGLTVAAGDPAAAVAELPIATLQPLFDDMEFASTGTDGAKRGNRKSLSDRANLGSRRIQIIERWGLKTLGAIATLSSVELSQRMGEGGVALQRLARGEDAAPLVPDPGVPRFVASMELEWPIDALEPLSFVLPRLLDPLSAALERADRGAAAIRLDMRLTDRSTHARTLLLPAAMRDARVLRTLLLLDLESHPPAAAIDVVSIEIDPAPARIVQYSLLDRATPSPETMATLMARLRALVGDERCGAPVVLDTHRPDGFVMGPVGDCAKGVFRLKAEAAAETFRLKAEATAPQLRRFRPAIAVRVTMERGRPVHVAIDRRGMPGGRVEQQAGPWRTSGAWWDAAATHWDRDEWDVAFTDGTLCRLFCDRHTGRWFLDGILD